MNNTQKNLYLTFDDGPHETETPFVLDTLKKYNAKATFFCIGKNINNNQEIYKRILHEGHTVGNHTENHLNGWKYGTNMYLENIKQAKQKISSPLFRPPYGRIKRQHIKLLQKGNTNSLDTQLPRIIVMWSVLSGDFDVSISCEKCLDNVLKHSKAGSIIVFHDSAKASQRLRYALPKTLDYFSKNGYDFMAL